MRAGRREFRHRAVKVVGVSSSCAIIVRDIPAAFLAVRDRELAFALAAVMVTVTIAT